MTLLSVVVVSYNTRELLRLCLKSIASETSISPHEVIVVDNASVDGSIQMVTEEFPGIQVLALEENLGFAAACNLGVRASSGRFVVMLNPDTVVRHRALDRLVAFAQENPAAGLYGGRTVTSLGELVPSSCWAEPSLWSLICFATGLSTVFRRVVAFNPEAMGSWRRDTVREVGVITGCLLLVSRQVWDELGGFDEHFWMYGEDADLCMRARALGYRPMITPEAEITHHVGGASGTAAAKRKLLLAGKVSLVSKHWTRHRGTAGVQLLVAGVAARALGARLAHRSDSPWLDVWRSRAEWRHGWPDSAGGRRPDHPQDA